MSDISYDQKAALIEASPTETAYSCTVKDGLTTTTIWATTWEEAAEKCYFWALRDGWKPQRYWWQFWRQKADAVPLEKARQRLLADGGASQ